MTHVKTQKAFTIVEVLVAAVIFSITVLGVFSTIAAIRKPAAVSERTLVAAYYGRQVLEDLRAKIDKRDWNTGLLSTGTHNYGTAIIHGVSYAASYLVENAPEATLPAGGLRKVTLTITWTELP